jgi:hypothetical protein
MFHNASRIWIATLRSQWQFLFPSFPPRVVAFRRKLIGMRESKLPVIARSAKHDEAIQ